jgi:hypothetical protein
VTFVLIVLMSHDVRKAIDLSEPQQSFHPSMFANSTTLSSIFYPDQHACRVVRLVIAYNIDGNVGGW